MAVNKPVGDNARKGAVKKRSQLKSTLGGATAWTKRSRASGEFMAVKKTAKKKTAAAFRPASGTDARSRPSDARIRRQGAGVLESRRHCHRWWSAAFFPP